MNFPYERQAFNNEPLPEGLDLADKMYYIGLRCLYAMHSKSLISAELAAEEKKKLSDECLTVKSELEFLNRESETLKNRIDKQAKNYKNNPTLENADKLYAAFYNLPENWREK